MSAKLRNVFVTGGTGYIGTRLIPFLRKRGHAVTALVREGSQRNLVKDCDICVGDPLNGDSYPKDLSSLDSFIQLVGVPHPAPSKARQFVEIHLKAGREAIRVAQQGGIPHFVYLSVAHPAPVMKSYIQVRCSCEAAIHEAGLSASILRPWYVLGPGHRWPIVLTPLYRLAGKISRNSRRSRTPRLRDRGSDGECHHLRNATSRAGSTNYRGSRYSLQRRCALAAACSTSNSA